MKVKFRAQLLTFFMTVFLTSSCLKKENLNQDFDSFVPQEISDGHSLSTPAAENMDAEALNAIYKEVYEDENLWSLRSLLIFRNGNLVAESYLKDPSDIYNRHLIWSATKQVMGVLVGLALEDSIISDLDDPISDYFDTELLGHEDKKDITIRNLLTMQSGIAFSNEGLNGESDKMLRQLPSNSVEFI